MESQVTYEQPLNERIRTFLRIEHLFDLTGYYLSGTSEWDSRLCMSTMLNVVDMLSRSDIKTELIKELERHASTLSVLRNNSAVDQDRLQKILGDISLYLETLRDTGCQPGLACRQDELVTSIKQRNTIPGGTCNFDLPAYHCWLKKSPAHRRQQLEDWQKDMIIIKRSVKLALQMVRNSTTPTLETAERGFYQKPIESNLSCQMIRVVMPPEAKYYPEISGGRHRFTVRFMEQPSTSNRAVQTEDNVEFELHCCIL